jgi:hypothetical protein
MKPVTREEILDLTAYEKARPAIRESMLAIKAPRRVHVGDALTFLFENRDTVRYQVQEMVRAERMVKEEEIEHELESYNELLGRKGELGAALLIEIDDPEVRAARLREWMGLPGRTYVRTATGRNEERLDWQEWDVSEFEGQTARLRSWMRRPKAGGTSTLTTSSNRTKQLVLHPTNHSGPTWAPTSTLR